VKPEFDTSCSRQFSASDQLRAYPCNITYDRAEPECAPQPGPASPPGPPDAPLVVRAEENVPAGPETQPAPHEARPTARRRDRAMTRKLPPPHAQAFLTCRQIYEDSRTREAILVGPFSGIRLSIFPSLFRMSLYAHLTGGHGTYRLALSLRDDEDEAAWGWEWPQPIEHNDPLEPYRVILHDALIGFPRPGRFALVLLANGEEVARHTLQVTEAPAEAP
jgi:hypothetical protein